MNKIVKRFTYVLVILFICFFLIQSCAKKIMDGATFQVSPSHVAPSAIGLLYREINIFNGAKKITAWLTEPRNKNNTVIILFNGIGGNRSGWIFFQNYFAEHGISTISFDYGPQIDTSKSMGSSRLSDVTKVVNSFIDTLQILYKNDLNLFLLGHSVGNAVMLEMYSNIHSTSIKGVIVCNAFASMKKWGVESGKLPKILSFVFPNYYDNVTNIKNVTQPILVIHSKADQINNFKSAQEIYASANSQKNFVSFDNYAHNDIFKKDNINYWMPILKFVQSHTHE